MRTRNKRCAMKSHKLPPLPDRNVVILLPETETDSNSFLIEHLRRQGSVLRSGFPQSDCPEANRRTAAPFFCTCRFIARRFSFAICPLPPVYADELRVIPPLDQHDTVLVLVDGLAANIGTLCRPWPPKWVAPRVISEGAPVSATLQSIPCIFNRTACSTTRPAGSFAAAQCAWRPARMGANWAVPSPPTKRRNHHRRIGRAQGLRCLQGNGSKEKYRSYGHPGHLFVHRRPASVRHDQNGAERVVRDRSKWTPAGAWFASATCRRMSRWRF